MLGDKISPSSFRSEWVPSIILAVFMLANSVTSFFLTVFFSEQLGFTAKQIGFLYSIHALTGMLIAAPIGMCNDRITGRTVVSGCLILLSAGFALMGMVKSFIPYALVFFIWALAGWGFRHSIDIQFLKTQSVREIGSRIGSYQAFRFLGTMAGMVIAGYLIEKVDFRASLIAVGGACMVLVIPSLLLDRTPMARVGLAEYRSDFSNRNVVLFAVWLLLFSSHWGAEMTCYGMFLRKNLHLSFSGMGWYMSAEFITLIIAVIYSGGLIGRKDNIRKIAVYGLLTSGIGHIGMVMSQSILISVSFRMLHGFGDGLMIVISYYGIAKLFSIERMGGNAGMINLATMFGYILGALIYSPLGASCGYGQPLWISGVLTLFLIIPLTSARLRPLPAPEG